MSARDRPAPATGGDAERWWSHRGTRRAPLIALGAVALVAVVALVIHLLAGGDGVDLSPDTLGGWTYVVAGLLVWGDAILAVLPGETTLAAASTLAAAGDLNLALVIVAGAVGAITGDTTLYWIARLTAARFEKRVERAKRNAKVALAFSYLGRGAPALLLAGRYVPGARFIVNASMGVTRYPYPRFLAWSALGGALWSVYTCVLAYVIATALAGFPLASVVISGAITTAAIAVFFLVLRRVKNTEAASAGSVSDVPSQDATSGA